MPLSNTKSEPLLSKDTPTTEANIQPQAGVPSPVRWMVLVAMLLAVPYGLIKTGIWKRSTTLSESSERFRDPDDLPIINPVKTFSMQNQAGHKITRQDLLGKVWLGAVIFTRCPGPCSTMTHRMADLQRSIPADWPIRLVSVTADSDYDTPEVLCQYADNFQADTSRWHFLHANKSDMVDLVTGSLKLVVLDKEQERQSVNDLFIHSTVLALVDRNGNLRGTFELVPPVIEEFPEATSDWETELKPKILRAIERLLNE